MSTSAIIEIVPGVQHYAWGRPADDALVCELAVASGAEAKQEDQPYAELWMGTHKACPSKVKADGNGLDQLLSNQEADLGSAIVNRFGKASGLPYLFKVLSVSKALSIQAHPDKKLAEALHAERPDVYKDPNHKPELALALTPFEALCGFRRPEEIAGFLEGVPELKAVVGEEAAASFTSNFVTDPKGSLKALYSSLMNADDATVQTQVQTLVSRLESEQATQSVYGLVQRLNRQFPGDVGMFSVFFLNVLTLEPGEALFLGPNLPHAYLSGECVECMACSDNVVRAGLTPKLKDTPTLISMLTYETGAPTVLTGTQEGDAVRLYEPNTDEFPEFSVRWVHLGSSGSTAAQGTAGPRIALCTGGNGVLRGSAGQSVETSKGKVLFVPAGVELSVDAGSEGVDLYIAGCRDSLFQ